MFSFPPNEAFDNNPATHHTAYTGTVWIAYQFVSPVSVAEVFITARGDDPIWRLLTLVLEYYDVVSWVALQTWAGLTWTLTTETKTLAV